MKRYIIKTSTLTALFLFSVPLVTQANDLSLHPLGNDVQLASLSPSAPAVGTQDSKTHVAPASYEISIQEVDVWERIRQGYGIPELDNALVSKQLAFYSSKPEYIQRTTDRAARYLFYIVQELEARGMPTELALLPFVESAFNPHAKSFAKAAGMWQFMPSTGLSFNLKQSSLNDERRNVLASTEAALNYLQNLYNMFGDWQLALAAYNWGEGSVKKAIKKNRAARKPVDFNSLSARMPAETRNYVPKLQAVKSIVANPEKYGITLPKIENQPYFVTIGKTRDMDVKVAANLAEMSMDDFRALNPQFGQHVITGGDKTQILLPHENADKFKVNLSKSNTALSSWTSYKVTGPRERIEEIATKYDTTPDVLREVNSIPPQMLLKSGSTILVPKSASAPDKDIAPEVAENATIDVEHDGPLSKRITVRVAKRDTLASIAKRHHVSVAQIQSWNHINGKTVATGTRLELHVPQKYAPSSKGSKLAKKKSRGKKKTTVAQTRSGKQSSPKKSG